MAMKKGKKVISVDFTGVEAGSAGKLLPEGPTKFEVADISEEEGEDSGKPYLAVTLEVVEGEENEGTKAWDNFSLQSQALWKFRGFLDACGMETEDGKMSIDPDELIGLVVVGDVVHEEYKGKTKHKIAGYSPVDAEDDEPAATTKKKILKKKEAEDDDTPEWTVKQKVAFMDGKKRMVGKITGIDDDKITVKVGDDEYEMGPDDLEAA